MNLFSSFWNQKMKIKNEDFYQSQGKIIWEFFVNRISKRGSVLKKNSHMLTKAFKITFESTFFSH